MHKDFRSAGRALGLMAFSAVLSALLMTGVVAAQTKAATPATKVVPIVQGVVSDKDLAANQEELIRLLKLSPTLTTVVARDPSLLSNQEYVRRNNPQLAQYLESHPEIGLNPDFYLFTRLKDHDGGPDQALERAVWPELVQPQHERSATEMLIDQGGPFLVFIFSVGALLWLIRQFLQNRRWGRIFKLQTEVHGKLIDKFGTSEELLTYMGTDAGKRFLEAAPIPVDFEPTQPLPNAVARVLNPLQIGVVLVLLGVGFFMLRHVEADTEVPMRVLGTLVLMPGIGFIVSAGMTWVLAGRLGLMPEAGDGHRGTSALDRNGR